MARRTQRGTRTAALAWAAIAEAGLAGVVLVWLISPTAAETAGYGPPLSILLLVVSMLLTAVGTLAVLVAPRLSRGVKVTVTFLLAATAGGVIPLAITGLFSSESGEYCLLLVLAVVGIEILALLIPRTATNLGHSPRLERVCAGGVLMHEKCL